MKKYLAEFVGTFALCFVVILSSAVTNFPLATPLLAALTLGLFVYSVGRISGTHINPAVTLAIAAIGKIDLKDALFYILAQVLAAAAAMGMARIMAIPLPAANPIAHTSALVAEAVGMFFFAFGIASAVYDQIPSGSSGVVVGGSLLLGIAVASLSGSLGILNPAVAFATQALTLPYIVGPIIGAVFGMLMYKVIVEGVSSSSEKKDKR